MKYNVIQPIQHDQQRYEPNSSIELSDTHAAPLLAINHIAKPEKRHEDSAGKKHVEGGAPA